MTFKEKLLVGWKLFLRFLYDSETGKILGRTFFSWSMSLINSAVMIYTHTYIYQYFSWQFSQAISVLCGLLRFLHGNICRPSVSIPCSHSIPRQRCNSMELWKICLPQLSKFKNWYNFLMLLHHSCYQPGSLGMASLSH